MLRTHAMFRRLQIDMTRTGWAFAPVSPIVIWLSAREKGFRSWWARLCLGKWIKASAFWPACFAIFGANGVAWGVERVWVGSLIQSACRIANSTPSGPCFGDHCRMVLLTIVEQGFVQTSRSCPHSSALCSVLLRKSLRLWWIFIQFHVVCSHYFLLPKFLCIFIFYSIYLDSGKNLSGLISLTCLLWR